MFSVTHAPPIFVAVVTSLVAAGMAFVLAARDPFDADFASLIISQISVHLVSSLAAVVGLHREYHARCRHLRLRAPGAMAVLDCDLRQVIDRSGGQAYMIMRLCA